MVLSDERSAYFTQTLSNVSAIGWSQDQVEIEEGKPKHIPDYHPGNNIFNFPPHASEANVRSQKQNLLFQAHHSSIKYASRTCLTGSPGQETIGCENFLAIPEIQGPPVFVNECQNYPQAPLQLITSIRNDLASQALKVNSTPTAVTQGLQGYIPDQESQILREKLCQHQLYQQQLHQEELKLTQRQNKIELQREKHHKVQPKKLQQQQIQHHQKQQLQKLQHRQQLTEQQKFPEPEKETIIPLFKEVLLHTSSNFKMPPPISSPNQLPKKIQISPHVQPNDENKDTNSKCDFPQNTNKSHGSNCTVIETSMLPGALPLLSPSSISQEETNLSRPTSRQSARSLNSRESNSPVFHRISDGQPNFTNLNDISQYQNSRSLQNNQVLRGIQNSENCKVPVDSRTSTGAIDMRDFTEDCSNNQVSSLNDINNLPEMRKITDSLESPRKRKRGRPRGSKNSVKATRKTAKSYKFSHLPRDFPQFPGYDEQYGWPQQLPSSAQQSRFVQQPECAPQSVCAEQPSEYYQHIPRHFHPRCPPESFLFSQKLPEYPQYSGFQQQISGYTQQLPGYTRQIPRLESRQPFFRNVLLPELAQQLPQNMQELPESMKQLPQNMQQFPRNIRLLPESMHELPQNLQHLPQSVEQFLKFRQLPKYSDQLLQQLPPYGQEPPNFHPELFKYAQPLFEYAQKTSGYWRHLPQYADQFPAYNNQLSTKNPECLGFRQHIPSYTSEISSHIKQFLERDEQITVRSQHIPTSIHFPIPSSQYRIQNHQFPDQDPPFSGKLKSFLERAHLSPRIQPPQLRSPLQRVSSPSEHLSSPLNDNSSPVKQFPLTFHNLPNQQSVHHTPEVLSKEPNLATPTFFRSWHISEALPIFENRTEFSERLKNSLMEQNEARRNLQERPSAIIQQNSMDFEFSDPKVVSGLPSLEETKSSSWVPTMPLHTASQMHDFEEELQTIGVQEAIEIRQENELQQANELREMNQLKKAKESQVLEVSSNIELANPYVLQVPVSGGIVTIRAVISDIPKSNSFKKFPKRFAETREWLVKSPPKLVIDSPTVAKNKKRKRFKRWHYKPRKGLKASINRYRARGIATRSPPPEVYLKEAMRNKDILDYEDDYDDDDENDENDDHQQFEYCDQVTQNHQDFLNNNNPITMNNKVDENPEMQDDTIRAKNSPSSRKENFNSTTTSEPLKKGLPVAHGIKADPNSESFKGNEIHHHGLPNLQSLLLKSDRRKCLYILDKENKKQEVRKKADDNVEIITINE